MTTETENSPHRFQIATDWHEILHSEVKKESDRAAVILVASMLDNSLFELLKNHLVPSASSSDDLFDGANAPFSNFNAKIAASFRLGLISSKFCRDLHLIRKVRNTFAHNIHGCSFSDSAVKSRVLELYKSTDASIKERHRQLFPEGPRGDFIQICSWMLWLLNCTVVDCKQLNVHEDEFGYQKNETKI